ncbi:hypothetical protein [Nitrosopumilus ureiphilus]|uniref:GOLD domain-containing protein n=1 Tax=Nitrosopumilus ureiphilus TaxID=1470067 RepID=A0A7D5M3N1_9ARCH|nr:hypothetical protein [Nitrosopumilus ureiphilus]QLH05813.1 hypothetical protein C5F50_00985 [Nitrosopumilus ureiphilus]
MKVSLFKIGLVMVILGMIWVSIIFNETEKTHDSILLKQLNSIEVKLEFSDKGIGYYKLYMPEFLGEEVFVQVLDTNDNVIQEKKVHTKMSVEYFDFSENGIHTVKVTNISKNPIDLQIEFGNTNSQKMLLPGIMILVGSLGLMITSYMKIKNYKIEQPEENIS